MVDTSCVTTYVCVCVTACISHTVSAGQITTIRHSLGKCLFRAAGVWSWLGGVIGCLKGLPRLFDGVRVFQEFVGCDVFVWWAFDGGAWDSLPLCSVA